MTTEAKPLAPGVPGLWLLGNEHLPVYLVRGETASALVEVGIAAVVPAVARQLEALGVTPDHLVVTHPHADHVTGLAGLRARYPEARVWAAPGAAEFLAHPKAAANLVAEERHMAAWLRRHGFEAEPGALEDPPSLDGAAVVREGDAVDLGGATLRFLRLTGHSPGNLGVHVPELGALFPSDSLGFHYPDGACCPLFFTGLGDYLETLDRLEALAPRLVAPGHQAVAEGPEAVARLFARSREAARDLAELARARRGDPEALTEELFRRTYVDVMTLYTPANVRGCSGLLVRRSLEAESR